MLKLVWLTCITGLGTSVEIYGFNLEKIHCELISRFHKMPELLPFLLLLVILFVLCFIGILIQ